MMSRARLVMRRRLPAMEWYIVMVRPLLLGFEMNDAVGNCEFLAKPPFVSRAEAGGMVAARCSWMLVEVRWGSGSKSSGACQVLRAPVKYCLGQNTRSCCSSWSAWWRT